MRKESRGKGQGVICQVEAAHAFSRVSVSFDEPNLVSHARLVPVAELAQRLRVAARIDETVAGSMGHGIRRVLLILGDSARSLGWRADVTGLPHDEFLAASRAAQRPGRVRGDERPRQSWLVVAVGRSQAEDGLDG